VELFAVEEVQFFAGLETDGFTWGNADFGPGARVASDAGFARAHVEDAEAAQLDALTLGKGALEGFEYGIDSGLCFVALQSGALNHLVNNVLFYQGVPPSPEVSLFRLIVEIFDGIVNAARLP
jgi:hypothetical protein